MTGGGEIHRPVLREEVVRLLSDVPGPILVDGTVGLGGHAEALLEADDAARLVGIDRDEAALALAAERLARFGERVHLVHGDSRDLASHLRSAGIERADGILLDLGVSSLQLDDPERGFSFRTDGPLDMRMDRSVGRPASAWLASAAQDEIVEVLRRYGEERYAGRIARRIVEEREKSPVETTGGLRRIVHGAVPQSYFDGKIDPATRTFQAIRIAVNDELEGVRLGLEAAFDALSIGGILVVISFHSLEDRLVKAFFREKAAACVCPPGLPECLCGKQVEAEILTRKPIVPGPEEVAGNPRARSAKLRAAKKIAQVGPKSDISCAVRKTERADRCKPRTIRQTLEHRHRVSPSRTSARWQANQCPKRLRARQPSRDPSHCHRTAQPQLSQQLRPRAARRLASTGGSRVGTIPAPCRFRLSTSTKCERSAGDARLQRLNLQLLLRPPPRLETALQGRQRKLQWRCSRQQQ